MMLVTELHEVIEDSRISVPFFFFACEEQVDWPELSGCWEVVNEPRGSLWLLEVNLWRY